VVFFLEINWNNIVLHGREVVKMILSLSVIKALHEPFRLAS
jgi:hypothetical protein